MLTVHTDGSHRSDDRQQYGAAGFDVRRGRTILHRSSAYLGRSDDRTIHFDELASIVLALEWLNDHHPDEAIELYNDNENAIKHVHGKPASKPYRTIIQAARTLKSKLNVEIEHISSSNNRAHVLAHPGVLHPSKLNAYRDCSSWARQFERLSCSNPPFSLSDYASASSTERRRLYRDHPRLALIRHVQIQARQNGVELGVEDVRTINKRLRSDRGSHDEGWGIARGQAIDDDKLLCELYHTHRSVALIGVADQKRSTLQTVHAAAGSIADTPPLSRFNREASSSVRYIAPQDDNFCGTDSWGEWFDCTIRWLRKKAHRLHMNWKYPENDLIDWQRLYTQIRSLRP